MTDLIHLTVRKKQVYRRRNDPEPVLV
ncbi:hypothetical protein ACFSQ7_47895 [Paenibacillus rhizoplanae]